MREPDLLDQRARAMRREATPAERRLWRALRGRRLERWKFRRQVPIGRYIADFACFEARLIVECDSSQHADSAYDADRDAWFKSHGWTVLRFWNAHVLEETEGVVDAILNTLLPLREKEGPAP